MLQSDTWYSRYTSTIWQKPATCNNACEVKSSAVVQPNVMTTGPSVSAACKPYVDDIGQPLVNAADVIAELGGTFDCQVYCQVLQEADWLSNSARQSESNKFNNHEL